MNYVKNTKFSLNYSKIKIKKINNKIEIKDLKKKIKKIYNVIFFIIL